MSASVSVIIPAYNAERTLRRAVDSVLAQSLAPREILIVDDGSRLPAAEALGHSLGTSSSIRLIRQANQGAAAARNRGLDEAVGDWIAFLDADDYWLPDKLARHLAAFARFPELGVTFSRYYEQAPEAEPVLVEKSIRGFPQFDQCRRYRGRDLFDVACCIWTGTVVARRELFAEVRFRSGLEPAEDRDVWVRLLQQAPVLGLQDALAVAVLEPGSLSRTQIDRDCGNMLRVIRSARSLLGWRGTWWWKRRTLRRWAAECLGGQNPAAWRPALHRWCYEPWSPEATWILYKSALLAGRRGLLRAAR